MRWLDGITDLMDDIGLNEKDSSTSLYLWLYLHNIFDLENQLWRTH